MPAIETQSLTKTFRVPEKEAGLRAALKSLFSRRFREVCAVQKVSFSIAEAELVGFLGANGAGKTTTLKMLSGLLHPTSGALQVLGHIPYERKAEFQKQITLVMGQRSQLWWELPAQETFRLNQKIYEIPEPEFQKSLAELTELLELKELVGIPVKKLSLGQRMKAELCAALLHRPKILLLDEPTLGLDVVMQKKVRNFILEYNRQRRATILLTSHNMDDVLELCPRVLIVDRGRLIFDGTLRQVVERYAPFKIIRADLAHPIALSEMEPFGKVLENGKDPTHLAVEVPRQEVSAVAARILQKFPVEDLTIEETPIDEVVRRIFTESWENIS